MCFLSRTVCLAIEKFTEKAVHLTQDDRILQESEDLGGREIRIRLPL